MPAHTHPREGGCTLDIFARFVVHAGSGGKSLQEWSSWSPQNEKQPRCVRRICEDGIAQALRAPATVAVAGFCTAPRDGIARAQWEPAHRLHLPRSFPQRFHRLATQFPSQQKLLTCLLYLLFHQFCISSDQDSGPCRGRGRGHARTHSEFDTIGQKVQQPYRHNDQ